jgi:hypothetical protein
VGWGAVCNGLLLASTVQSCASAVGLVGVDRSQHLITAPVPQHLDGVGVNVGAE